MYIFFTVIAFKRIPRETIAFFILFKYILPTQLPFQRFLLISFTESIRMNREKKTNNKNLIFIENYFHFLFFVFCFLSKNVYAVYNEIDNFISEHFTQFDLFAFFLINKKKRISIQTFFIFSSGPAILIYELF